MTTSSTPPGYPMTDFPPPPASGSRVLRRGRTNRVAAGVASGLGEYFAVDPVLFRVLFATSAFFGGAGILAYLLAWAAIPEADTERASIDRWIAALRQRRFPVWLVFVAGGLLLWAAAFSWWAPGPFFPVVAVVVLLVVFFARREMQPGPGTPPVSLRKKDAPPPPAPPAATSQPAWVTDARLWLSEMRALAQERRRRSFPIRAAVMMTLVGALTGLGIADAIVGIELQWYFWTVLVVVAVGILAAAASRRWSWSLVPLLVPAAVGVVAFAGSDTSLHDGVGQREWKPTTAVNTHYRLAFGQGVLDLRDLKAPTRPARITVTLGAGQMKVIAPSTLNLTVRTDVHAGQVEVEDTGAGTWRHSGVEFTRTIDAPRGASGVPVTVVVHLTDGNLTVERRG
ncbi:MAG TPA: PspC domain-containing protein [Jatrophihabitans sp.]|nr:PspC domain-containing protein [Jatrophihabitans sp.]